jgi:hypothetical protein
VPQWSASAICGPPGECELVFEGQMVDVDLATGAEIAGDPRFAPGGQGYDGTPILTEDFAIVPTVVSLGTARSTTS